MERLFVIQHMILVLFFAVGISLYKIMWLKDRRYLHRSTDFKYEDLIRGHSTAYLWYKQALFRGHFHRPGGLGMMDIPRMGFGTYPIGDKNLSTVQTVLDSALTVGYRLFDTTFQDQKEHLIGTAMQELLVKHKLKRHDIMYETKISDAGLSPESIRYQVRNSLNALQTPYLDIVLIQSPLPATENYLAEPEPESFYRARAWLTLEKLKRKGLIRHIGISNYWVCHMEEMDNYATIRPAIHQFEVHPHGAQFGKIHESFKRGMLVQANTPLGRNHPQLINEPLLGVMADKHNATVHQILLAWALGQHIAVVPKSTGPSRIQTNFEAQFITTISKSDIQLISTALNRNVKYPFDVYPNPSTNPNPILPYHPVFTPMESAVEYLASFSFSFM